MKICAILENISPQQRGVGQLPADFDPPNTSPQLSGPYPGRNATRGYLVGESSDQELYGLRVGDTVMVQLDGGSAQGDIIDIYPDTQEVELLLRGPEAGRTITVDVRDTQALDEQSVREGHADQQRKIFKKNGEPVGEVGIDRESSPGVGQYYMKHYASSTDLSGYDSREEALAELRHIMKQSIYGELREQGIAEADTTGPHIVYATGPRTQGINDVDLVFKDTRTGKIVARVVGNNRHLQEFAPPSGGDGGDGRDFADRPPTYEIRMGDMKRITYVAFGDPEQDSEHSVYKLGPAKPGAPKYYGQGLTLVSELDWWSFLEKMIGEIMWEDDAIEAGYVDRLDNGDLVFAQQQGVAEGLMPEMYRVDESQLNEIDPGLLVNLVAVFPTITKIIVNNALTKATQETKETAQMVDVLKKKVQGQEVTPEESADMKAQFKDLLGYGLSAVGGALSGGALAGLAGVYKKELLELIRTKGPEVLIHLLKTKGNLDVVKILSAKFLAKHALPLYPAPKSMSENGYNPLADERREQSQMDAERLQFKRDELAAELGGEEQRAQQIMSGTWYIVIDGQVWKRGGQPVTFPGRDAARRAGQTIKNRTPERTVTITTKLPTTENATRDRVAQMRAQTQDRLQAMRANAQAGRDRLRGVTRAPAAASPAAPAAAPPAASPGRASKTNAAGVTQHDWMAQARQNGARLIQAKMIDGPVIAIYPDGRRDAWQPVGDAVSESVKQHHFIYETHESMFEEYDREKEREKWEAQKAQYVQQAMDRDEKRREYERQKKEKEAEREAGRTHAGPQGQHEYIAPHGDARNEVALFQAGTKPAALINPPDVGIWSDLINSGRYVLQRLKLSGQPDGYVIGQPGEEERVEKIHALVQNANDRAQQGDFSPFQNSNYHRWLGRLLGYPASKIEQFITNYFRDTPDRAQARYDEDADFHRGRQPGVRYAIRDAQGRVLSTHDDIDSARDELQGIEDRAGYRIVQTRRPAGSWDIAESREQRYARVFREAVASGMALEDVVDQVRGELGDYLQIVARAMKKRPEAMKPRQRPEDRLGPPLRTIHTDDGREIHIHGNEDDGFRISIGGRTMRESFAQLSEAEIATELYCARRRQRDYQQER